MEFRQKAGRGVLTEIHEGREGAGPIRSKEEAWAKRELNSHSTDRTDFTEWVSASPGLQPNIRGLDLEG